ncbi:MAG: hypothetical protein K2L00_05805, partial [Muribaculaceae bacterium]|nr:hypothetical protein [Muribaculaceae bacterium]
IEYLLLSNPQNYKKICLYSNIFAKRSRLITPLSFMNSFRRKRHAKAAEGVGAVGYRECGTVIGNGTSARETILTIDEPISVLRCFTNKRRKLP